VLSTSPASDAANWGHFPSLSQELQGILVDHLNFQGVQVEVFLGQSDHLTPGGDDGLIGWESHDFYIMDSRTKRGLHMFMING